jgi:hypothetical protein
VLESERFRIATPQLFNQRPIRYSKLAENIELRKEWALRAGLGFDISLIWAQPPRTVKSRKEKSATHRAQPLRSPLLEETVVAGLDPAAQETPKLAAEPEFVAQDSDLDPLFFEQPAPAPTQEEIDAELARLAELRAILEGAN